MSVTMTLEQLQRIGRDRITVAPGLLRDKPRPPENLTVTASRRFFRIQWSKVDGVDGYRVAIMSDQDLSSPDLLIEKSGEDTMEHIYHIGNQAATRFFAVQSFAGNESSDFSSIVSGSTRIDGSTALASNFQIIAAPANTSENDLRTYTLPGGALGNNDAVRIVAMGISSGVGGTKTLRLYFGATVLLTETLATGTVTWRIDAVVGNVNSASSQRATVVALEGTTIVQNARPTAAVNTANDVVIKITGQKADGADGFQQEAWIVEQIQGEAEAAPSTPPAPPPEPPTGEDPSKPGKGGFV